MSLRQRITDDMKEAMKSGDKLKVSTLRLVNAAIKDKDIQNRTDGPDAGVGDASIVELLAKMVKQRQESAETYDKGGRPELAEQERGEIAIIQTYMPKQLSDDEAKAAIAGLVAEIGAAGMKDMGRTMAALKDRFAGQMDMTKASGLVKAVLSGG